MNFCLKSFKSFRPELWKSYLSMSMIKNSLLGFSSLARTLVSSKGPKSKSFHASWIIRNYHRKDWRKTIKESYWLQTMLQCSSSESYTALVDAVHRLSQCIRAAVTCYQRYAGGVQLRDCAATFARARRNLHGSLQHNVRGNCTRCWSDFDTGKCNLLLPFEVWKSRKVWSGRSLRRLEKNMHVIKYRCKLYGNGKF